MLINKTSVMFIFFLCVFSILVQAEASAAQLPEPTFKLADTGTEDVVDYEAYGNFNNVGKGNYRYQIENSPGLAEAVGEGIFPNRKAVLNDPLYLEYSKKGMLKGSHWEFINIDDQALSFYKWAIAPESPGVKQYHVALALEKSGHIRQALKAYYAILVQFPKEVGWTYFGTPWYVGKVAKVKIDYLLRKYPSLGLRLEGAEIIIDDGFDTDVKNDVFLKINPGRLVKVDELGEARVDLSGMKAVKEVGGERIKLVQYENSHWQLFVDNKPFMIKAMSYKPVKIGQSPDEGTEQDWMLQDNNKNGLIDAPEEAWVDKNANGIQDSDEPSVGDFKLMKDMGVNTLRLYHHASNKDLLKKMYNEYGIMVMMGDFVGMYTVGSGASWDKGTDYTDPQQRENMFASVKKMVNDFKDEPYILMWVLGNENNYPGVFGHVGGGGNAHKYPKEYYSFINELARWVKQADPTRPVAVCNGDTLFFDVLAENCPDVDVFGANSYQGNQGFVFWEDVKRLYDKPVVITEFGCPAYHEGKNPKVAEVEQADYNWGTWTDILSNSAGYKYGAGNALGGVVFEFVDGWWKSGQAPFFSPYVHEPNGQWKGPFPNGWSYEEWFGLCSQGSGENSPFARELRESYYVYKDLWTSEVDPVYAAGRIVAEDKDVFRYKEGKWDIVLDLPRCHEVYALKKDNNGNLWAAGSYFGDGRVWKFDGSSWNDGETLNGALVIYALALDSQGNIYAGGAGKNNIWKFDGQSWSKGEQIPDLSAVYSLCVDNEGWLWAGGAKLNSANVWYKDLSGKWLASGRIMGSDAIHALTVDNEGNIYAGGKSQTDRKVWKFNKNRRRWDRGVALDGSYAVYAFLKDNEGNIYAGGSGEKEVWIYNGSAWQPGEDLVDCIGVYALCEDNEGNIYAGGWSQKHAAKVWIKKNGRWDSGKGLAGFVIRAVEAIP